MLDWLLDRLFGLVVHRLMGWLVDWFKSSLVDGASG